MPKPTAKFTPGQRDFIDQMRAETHTVAVAGVVTQVEEVPGNPDEGTVDRVRITVSGDNGTAVFEAVPPLTREETEQVEADLAAAAETAAAEEAAAREAETEKAQAEAAEAARSEHQRLVDELLTSQREAQAAFEKRVTGLIAAEVERRMPGASGS